MKTGFAIFDIIFSFSFSCNWIFISMPKWTNEWNWMCSIRKILFSQDSMYSPFGNWRETEAKSWTITCTEEKKIVSSCEMHFWVSIPIPKKMLQGKKRTKISWCTKMEEKSFNNFPAKMTYNKWYFSWGKKPFPLELLTKSETVYVFSSCFLFISLSLSLSFFCYFRLYSYNAVFFFVGVQKFSSSI